MKNRNNRGKILYPNPIKFPPQCLATEYNSLYMKKIECILIYLNYVASIFHYYCLLTIHYKTLLIFNKLLYLIFSNFKKAYEILLRGYPQSRIIGDYYEKK